MHANRNKNKIEPQYVFNIVGKCICLMSLVLLLMLSPATNASKLSPEEKDASAQDLEAKAKGFEDQPLTHLDLTRRFSFMPLKGVEVTKEPYCVHRCQEVERHTESLNNFLSEDEGYKF